MCSIDNARETLVAQICAAEELLRSLPGSSHPKCFIDLTDEVGNGVVVLMRLIDCPRCHLPRICINSYDLDDARQIDSESYPFASMAIAELGTRSLMMLGRHVPALIETAKLAEHDAVAVAEHVATAIATAVGNPEHRPTRVATSSLRHHDGVGVGMTASLARHF